jgi:hypothetical protein
MLKYQLLTRKNVRSDTIAAARGGGRMEYISQRGVLLDLISIVQNLSEAQVEEQMH